jgi:broad specificity phosphatase PhoE
MPIDKIRGSVDIPLNTEGLRVAAKMARRIKQAGGVDVIYSSPLKRSMQTAAKIAMLTGASIHPDNDLKPWHLGKYEGQATKEVIHDINWFILNRPDVKMSGKHDKSTEPGESFNDFRTRFLKAFSGMKASESERLLIVTHYRCIKLLQSWFNVGAPPSFEVDAKEMVRKDGDPGTLYRVEPKGKTFKLVELVPQKGDMVPGIYVMRHSITDWNGNV